MMEFDRLAKIIFLVFISLVPNLASANMNQGRAELGTSDDSDIIVVSDQNDNPKNLSQAQIESDILLEAEISNKVSDMLKEMTIEEKVGQMTQITLDVISNKGSSRVQSHSLNKQKLDEAILTYHVGSILNVSGNKAHSIEEWHKLLTQIQDVALQDRLKIPVLYGIDSIHGAQYTFGATIFPQSIAMAATWNPSLSARAGEITALETRLTGIPWNFFPVLDIGRQPVWPRFYETYGEDVYLAKSMGWSNIIGQQGLTKAELGSSSRVAACMKHYVGYSFPWSGKDRTPAIITEKMMREYFLPTFASAVKAGAQTVMINSGEVDGIPGHANHHLITEVLKGEMNFKGFVVSDWEDIKRLYSRDHFADSPEEAVRIAVMAGVDMSMVPFDYSFANILTKLVKSHLIPMERIDDAVGRILRVKYLVGIFKNPYPPKDSKSRFGAKESAIESQAMAGESLTLLKNKKSILPLSKNTKVLVTGPAANLLSVLNGGWTLTWQGDNEELYPKDKKTIFGALQESLGSQQVSYFKGVEFNKKAKDYSAALEAVKNSDVVVLCLGEKTYTETEGNINDMSLEFAQLDYVKKLYQEGKPIILILVEGRPRIVREIEPFASAIINAYLPGMEGGRAIAQVLLGEVNPSGKLPFSYPRFVNSLVPYDHKYQEDNETSYNPQWPFGFGLSYAKFKYKQLELNQRQFDIQNGLQVKVTVTNEGAVEGKEVIQLYLSDLFSKYSSPPVKKLIDFKKITLAPQESKVINFVIKLGQLSFIAPDNRRIVEKGTFKIQVDNLSESFKLQ